MKPCAVCKGETVVISIPMQLKRRGGRKEVLVPEGLEGARPTKSPTQQPLLTALARAFHWQELLDSGRHASITELAEALRLDRSYVGRILRLTLLAPDIVDAVVEGREPSGMSLERLTKGMPVEWTEQRAHRAEQIVKGKGRKLRDEALTKKRK